MTIARRAACSTYAAQPDGYSAKSSRPPRIDPAK